MKYRPEIDGLRAIAVIPVILFHAGFSWVSGGFVGVDIFFVISGYLITSILISDFKSGSFSIVQFYERRARRILPALFFVMLISMPLAWVLLLPNAMKSFSDSLIAVPIFSSNFQFLKESDYFAAATEMKPLIHTWSLAVEEQFYLIFPIILLITWRTGNTVTTITVALILIASLITAQKGAYTHPDSTYFMLHTRAWELAIGSLVAFYQEKDRPPNSRWLAESGSFLGIVLILFSALTYNKETPFPSFYALIPTLGSALIIIFASRDILIGKIIGSRPFVAVGLISYSAYLWHQPVFAFARQYTQGLHETSLQITFIAISFGMALFTWRYVERPFRKADGFTRKQIFASALICSSTFIIIGIIGHKTQGFIFRYPKQQHLLSFEKYDVEKIYRSKSCFLNNTQSFGDFNSECGLPGTEPEFLVWGDSHAAALSYGLRQTKLNTSQYTTSGCPPLMDTRISDRENCSSINKFILEKTRATKPKNIVIAANWLRYKEKGIDPAKEIEKTINSIKESSPSSRIIILGQIPLWPPSLPENLFSENIDLGKITYLKNNTLPASREIDEKLSELSNGKNIIFFSPIENLCQQNLCLATVEDKEGIVPIVWDDGHLTAGGSIYLTRKIMTWLGKNRAKH